MRKVGREGTIVAGHPAILTLFFDDRGIVAGLRIETDPQARLYKQKKAFLLGLQVKSRYGNEGWADRASLQVVSSLWAAYL